MPHHTSDTRIVGYEPLLAPAALLQELPLGQAREATVEQGRADVRAVLEGTDDRLLVVVGPCSVHNPVAALDYARRLAGLRRSLDEELLIVMRVYFEKPRTVTGWKGHQRSGPERPLRRPPRPPHRAPAAARCGRAGLPVGCEWLDPVTPQYIADAVAWGAIGARTTESQVHRQLASGLSMPVGFKNGTDGDAQVAIDACRGCGPAHVLRGDAAGAAAVVNTAGNSECHIILRGGRSGPNYYVATSPHAGPGHQGWTAPAPDGRRKPRQQREGLPPAARGGGRAGSADRRRRAGPGRRDAGKLHHRREAGPRQPAGLAYGQSITDSCMDFDTTAQVLDALAAAVRRRREVHPDHARRSCAAASA